MIGSGAVAGCAILVTALAVIVFINQAKDEALDLANKNARLAKDEKDARETAEEEEYKARRLLYLTHMREVETALQRDKNGSNRSSSG